MAGNIRVSSVGSTIPYDNSTSQMASTNMQSAMDEAAVIIATITFSYKFIQSSDSVLIPLNREMVVNNYIDIDGNLTIEGDLSIV